MVICKETLEREIEASKAALKSHEEGITIHEVVLAAFESELKVILEAEELCGELKD